MQRAVALKQYLEGTGLWNPERVELAIREGTPAFSGSTAGADVLLFRHEYAAEIDLEGASGDVRDVLAHVLVWLAEHGGEEDTLESWDGEPLDRHRADITLRLRFLEAVHYVPAEPEYEGPDRVTWGGVAYRRGDATPDTADTLGGVVEAAP